MDWFYNLLNEILPLYVISALGFVAGKKLGVEAKSISTLTIYMLAPMVFFISLAQVSFSVNALIAPALTFILAGVVAPAVLWVGKFYMGERTPYLAALATGTSNWGYFGLPIAFFVFPPEGVAAYILIGFGFQLFENTLGVYYISRGHKSPLESLLNIFKLPAIYAIVFGLLLSFSNVQIPASAEKLLDLFKGAYTVTGMMMIGLGLAAMDKFNFDWKFNTTMAGIRFIMWPVVMIFIVWADMHLNILGSDFHKPLLLFGIMPMAANNIAFAAQFNMHPEKAAVSVLFTTIFALFYIPLALKVLGIL